MQYNGTGENFSAQKCKPKGAFADRNYIICIKKTVALTVAYVYNYTARLTSNYSSKEWTGF